MLQRNHDSSLGGDAEFTWKRNTVGALTEGWEGALRREITPGKHGGWARGNSGPYFLNLFSASFLIVLISHFLLLLETVSRLPIS